MLPAGIRITSVRAHRLQARLRERFGWSLGWTLSRSSTLVEVRTSAGLTGWGQGEFGGALLTAKPELVLGRTPFEVEAIYEDLRTPPAHQHRAGANTAPGLDIALWDLVGQALGLPLSMLLGKRRRDRVPAYCTALYRRDCGDLAAELAREAVGWQQRGFRILKMKTGYGPDLDVHLVSAVRNALGPSMGLAIDSNCAYDAGTARALGARLEHFGLLWWEEPLVADDLAGYAQLRGSLRLPLAAGETEPAGWLIANYIQPRLLDIVQPDVEIVGLTGARAVSQLCWLDGIRMIPHAWGTGIGTAATLHLMACCPPLTPAIDPPTPMFELDRTENPFRDSVIRRPFEFDPTDGCVPVPTGPGLGIDVLSEAVAHFRTELIEIS